MLLVVGVSDCLNKIIKSWNACTVIRRTRELTIRAYRIARIRINGKVFLQADRVLLAEAINSFYREFLNPYLNYHRPSSQADVEIDKKGRKRICYRRYQTPLETLLALHNPAPYLRPGLTINALRRIAAARSDTGAARRVQQAKAKLFPRLRLSA